jgi:hypothetical protein
VQHLVDIAKTCISDEPGESNKGEQTIGILASDFGDALLDLRGQSCHHDTTFVHGQHSSRKLIAVSVLDDDDLFALF